jgi:hypothetical protein
MSQRSSLDSYGWILSSVETSTSPYCRFPNLELERYGEWRPCNNTPTVTIVVDYLNQSLSDGPEQNPAQPNAWALDVVWCGLMCVCVCTCVYVRMCVLLTWSLSLSLVRTVLAKSSEEGLVFLLTASASAVTLRSDQRSGSLRAFSTQGRLTVDRWTQLALQVRTGLLYLSHCLSNLSCYPLGSGVTYAFCLDNVFVFFVSYIMPLLWHHCVILLCHFALVDFMCVFLCSCVFVCVVVCKPRMRASVFSSVSSCVLISMVGQ